MSVDWSQLSRYRLKTRGIIQSPKGYVLNKEQLRNELTILLIKIVRVLSN
jgi:hypothetical protein